MERHPHSVHGFRQKAATRATAALKRLGSAAWVRIRAIALATAEMGPTIRPSTATRPERRLTRCSVPVVARVPAVPASTAMQAVLVLSENRRHWRAERLVLAAPPANQEHRPRPESLLAAAAEVAGLATEVAPASTAARAAFTVVAVALDAAQAPAQTGVLEALVQRASVSSSRDHSALDNSQETPAILSGCRGFFYRWALFSLRVPVSDLFDFEHLDLRLLPSTESTEVPTLGVLHGSGPWRPYPS